MSDNGASRVPPVDETPAAESAEPITAVSLAWLPAGDYERALDLWPDFAGSDLVTGPTGRWRTRCTAGGCSKSWSNSPRLVSQDWRSPRSAWHPSLPGAPNRVRSRTRRRPAPVCRVPDSTR